ncbi:PAS domain-containing sensor histidine kinase [Catalinimonas niigatensis]|uniref:PAS domain-containing sensor histidine kinase n=1 Tax=Catalinimonas niigatensis TaxID=1397264 RepID=UPI002664EBED|nr:PAS domain S-box protein [Catalinimonas niigatensis]WPP49810.1 PAS domain S-box protein [Catalinimonas niigatensis]
MVDNKKLLHALFQASVDGILVVNHAGIVVMANPSCLRMFGYDEHELIGQPLEILLNPAVRTTHSELRSSFFNSPHTRPMGLGRDLQGQRKNGQMFPVEVSLNYMKVDRQMYAVAIITDITTRKAAEEALKHEKEVAQMYLDTAASVFLALDKHGKVKMINQKGCQVLGYTEGEMLGKDWFEYFLPACEKERVREVFSTLMQGKINSLEFYENQILTKNHEERLIEWHNVMMLDQQGQPSGTLSSGIDITEKRRTETKVMKALIEGQEAERERVATELHDGLGQGLSVMQMNIKALEVACVEPAPKEILQKLNEVLSLTIKEVKSIARNLMPAVLKDYGLEKALEYLCQSVNESNHVRVKFQSYHMDKRIESSKKKALYRVTQELLNNILKHAEAEEVNVQLFGHQKSISLVVEDDGKGFDPFAQNQGFGLRNIESRVKAFEGKLCIDTKKGHGTTVAIEIPLEA